MASDAPQHTPLMKHYPAVLIFNFNINDLEIA
jgi:hypothetical protein